nr:hypothetical transcript [Hymenolepis microstoma]
MANDTPYKDERLSSPGVPEIMTLVVQNSLDAPPRPMLDDLFNAHVQMHALSMSIACKFIDFCQVRGKEPTFQPIAVSTLPRKSSRERKSTKNANFIYDLPKLKRGRTAPEHPQGTQTRARQRKPIKIVPELDLTADSNENDDKEIGEGAVNNRGELDASVVVHSTPKRWYEKRLTKNVSDKYPSKDPNKQEREWVQTFSKGEVIARGKKASVVFVGDGDIDGNISRK